MFKRREVYFTNDSKIWLIVMTVNFKVVFIGFVYRNIILDLHELNLFLMYVSH